MEVRPDMIPRQGTEVHLLSCLVRLTAPAGRGGAGRVELVERYTEVNTFYQPGHTNTIIPLIYYILYTHTNTIIPHIYYILFTHTKASIRKIDALLSWFCHNSNSMKIVIEITTYGEICQIRIFLDR